MTSTIRFATSDDLDLVTGFIRRLAEYEKLVEHVRFDRDTLARHLFGERPMAEVLIAERDGQPRGFALFFHNFSTFEGRPGIYLEDLFVDPDARGLGLGRALFSRLGALAVERGCARLDWSVLDWNESAKGFYRSIGARHIDDWEMWRLEGKALARLQEGANVRAPIPRAR